MPIHSLFYRYILDALTEHISVLNSNADIVLTNKAWDLFATKNLYPTGVDWQSINYLDECDRAAERGDDWGKEAGFGIRKVMSTEFDSYSLEYPCHSPTKKRWFIMRASAFNLDGASRYVVIAHQNITERKIAELKAVELSRLDGLTGLPNRRAFDDFLSEEWKRCERLGLPISLAMIDIDYFKLLNDTYGHQKGDECLRQVADTIKKYGRRPGDIHARYGGEEFVVVLGNTSLSQAHALIDKLHLNIASLGIPNRKSPIQPTVTASIGLSQMYPRLDNSEKDLIEKADELLYAAKSKGRNQIVTASPI